MKLLSDYSHDRVRWLTHTGREVSPSGLEDRCWRIGKEESWWWRLGPVAYAHRQESVALRAEDRCWRILEVAVWF
jgi:hypothetical protein